MYRRYFIGTGIFLLFLFLSATPLTIVKSYDEGCLGEFCLPNDPPAQPQPQPLQPSPSQINQYQPLVNLPGLTSGTRTLTDYVNVLFRLAIGIGALIAVIRLVLAGIKYMGDDAFSSKAEAKKDIQAVLVGLLIMLSTYVILNTIWPGILRLDLLSGLQRNLSAPPIQTPQTPAPLRVVETPQEVTRRIEEQNGRFPDQQRESGGSVAVPWNRTSEQLQEIRRECEARGGATHLIPDPTGENSAIATCVLTATSTPQTPPAQEEQYITGPIPTRVEISPYIQSRMAQSGKKALFSAVTNAEAATADQQRTANQCCALYGGTVSVERDLDQDFDVLLCSAPLSTPAPATAIGPTCSQLLTP